MEVRYFHGYSVREDGEVRSKRQGAVKQTRLESGSKTVTLYYEGCSHSFTVAKLVAMVFIPNDVGEDAIVEHIDGDKSNNHKSNLRWVKRGTNPLATRVECTLPDGTKTVYDSQNKAANALGLKSNRIISHYITGSMKDPRGGVWKKIQ